MRRNLVAFLGTLSGLVLLFSYHTSLDSSGPTTATAGPLAPGGTAKSGADGSGGSSSSASGSSGTSGSSTTGSAPEATSAGGSTTYAGEVADTEWGPVQVQITVENGKITAARPTQVPNGNFRDQEINSYAVPILNQEVLQAQSARIDAVSGATVTSDGYVQSLQSAIDQAHL
jgi:uncharacterized protein with FMN-binding domain